MLADLLAAGDGMVDGCARQKNEENLISDFWSCGKAQRRQLSLSQGDPAVQNLAKPLTLFFNRNEKDELGEWMDQFPST